MIDSLQYWKETTKALKIGIFGCGNIYLRYRNLIPKSEEVVAIIDNDVTMHGIDVDGLRRIYPREYTEIQVDIIILMSDAAVEMREQLIRCGCPENKIVHYKDYFGALKNKKEIYKTDDDSKNKKNLLIISNELGYHGGPIVAMRTARCAKELGYKVTIAASEGQNDFINELNQKGINVIIQEWLMNASWSNLQWVNSYDAIIVNTFPMVNCAIEISMHREVILWLHESVDSYYGLEFWHNRINIGLRNKSLKLFAVTKRACENLYRFYGNDIKADILTVAIEDWKKENNQNRENTNLVYAVIGYICKAKGQDVFLNALKENPGRKDNIYILIGRVQKSAFCEYVRRESFYENNIVLIGERTQEEMRHIQDYIDIVVVPSRAESFSMVAAEAMMMGRVCIISDDCGISEYIVDGVNGFVFRSGSTEELGRIMLWCDNHKEKLLEIGKNARKTFEENFTTELLKKRLEEIL